MKTLVTLSGDSLRRKISEDADIPKPELSTRVAQISKVAEVVARFGIPIPDTTIDKLEKRLPDAPASDVPLLLAAIVNLRALKSIEGAGLLQQILSTTTRCVEGTPSVVAGEAPTRVEGTRSIYKIRLREFHDCVQVLDGTYWTSVRFTRCLLVYRGGPVGWGLIITSQSLFRIGLPPNPSKKAISFTAELMPKVGSPEIQLTAPSGSNAPGA